MGVLEEKLRSIDHAALKGMRRGIEKESLRVLPNGALALTPHTAALGSALTHPHITTDFSESQLELITGVHASAEACLEELTHIHQAVYRAIYAELNARLQSEALRLGEPNYLNKDEAGGAALANDNNMDRAWDLWVRAAKS